MLEAFKFGGWGMYPTLVFGALTIAAAASYARTPERRRLTLLAILSVVTLVAGLLGFTTGLMVTLDGAAGTPNQSAIIAAGTFESLNNVALALTLLALSGVVAAVGALRAGSGSGGQAAPTEAPATAS